MSVDESSERYLRGAVLGRGSTATVYRAHDQVLDRPVALKELHLDLGAAAVLAEARAAARITHPNVVIIHDVLDQGSGSCIAMELLEGPTLAQVLRGRALNSSEAFRVVCDIAAALDAAHRNGIVHCDIKPDNIFVTDAGRVVVTDFGLANPELGGGTPGYMAPEQHRDEDPTAAVDVFAWGCVAVEVFAGAPPFGLDQVEASYRTLHEPPRGDLSVAEDHRGLVELIVRCLDKDPSGRPATGAEVLAELAAIAAGNPPMTVPGPRPTVANPAVVAAPPADFAPIQRPAAPHPVTTIRLVVYPQDATPYLFELRAGEHIEVGREATLVIDDPLASRRHAHLWFDGLQLQVTDLGSMNGTVCNGQRIHEYLAAPGDVVTIGSTVIRIEAGE